MKRFSRQFAAKLLPLSILASCGGGGDSSGSSSGPGGAIGSLPAAETAHAIAVRGNDLIVGGSDGVVATFATLCTNGVKQRLNNGFSVVSAVTATESGVSALAVR